MRNTLFGFLLASITFFPVTQAVARPDFQVVRSAPYVFYEGFLTEFQSIDELTEEQLNQLFSRYSSFLSPSSDVTTLMNSLEGRESVTYPLAPLKGASYYAPQIKKFVASKNPNNQIFAFAVLSAANDSSFNGELRKAMREGQSRNVRLWAGMALLHLRDEETSALFDFLVAEEDFSDPHLSNLYFKLPPERLLKTAYEKSDSKDPKSRILVLRSFIAAGINKRSDQLVRNFIRDWDPETRGYAIGAAGHLGMPNLAGLLQPMVEDSDLKGIVMHALANSPSSQDQALLSEMVRTPENLEGALEAYFSSRHPEAVRVWLKMLSRENLPKDYTFFMSEQPLLMSNDLHQDVLNAVNEVKNPELLASLLRALKGREDAVSVERLVSFLRHSDSGVRYWSADALEGIRSPLLATEVPNLLGDPHLRTSALTNLAITNRIDDLQKIFLPLLTDPSEREWRRSAAEYLAVYPGTTPASVFREALAKEDDSFTKRDLVIGLAKVGEEADVELIVKALREEPPDAQNAVHYLIALSTLKGDKARTILEGYLESSNEQIRNFVRERLADW